MVTDGRGGFIAVWNDERCCTQGPTRVYAQHVDLTGTPQWVPEGIEICNVSGPKRDLVAVSDGAGGAIVGWVDQRTDGRGVYVQRIGSGGSVLWTAGGVGIWTGGNTIYFLTALADGSGGAFFVWRMSSQGYQLFAQHVTGEGVALWASGGLPVSPLLNWGVPAIAPDDSGGIIVAWGEANPSQLSAQRVDANGQLRWGANGIVLRSGAASPPRLAALGVAGGAIVTWNEAGTILSQRVDLAGTPQWPDPGTLVATGVYFVPPIPDNPPVIIPSGEDGVIVGWRTANERAIRAQRLDGAGAKHWSAQGATVVDSTFVVVGVSGCGDQEGGAIFAWGDFRGGACAFCTPDIYASRLTQSGARAWNHQSVPVSTAQGWQGGQEIVSDGAGGALLFWNDGRVGWEAAAQLRAQNLRHDGTLGGSLLGVDPVIDLGSGVMLGATYPNPAGRSGLTISFTVPRSQPMRIAVFDASGRLVRTLASGHTSSGARETRWDARDATGQPSPAGIYWIVVDAQDGRTSKRVALIH